MTAAWRLNYTRLLGQLRKGRARLAMSQEAAADALSISRRTFQRWEAGEADPNAIELFRWAHLVGVSITSEPVRSAPDLAQ